MIRPKNARGAAGQNPRHDDSGHPRAPSRPEPTMTRRLRSGFTLIEVAIVLVIIGLLVAGIIKGQELMTGARVRNVIQQHDGARAAFLGFMDRYRQPPGDFALAAANITGV